MNNDELLALRHSLAHILAMAVLEEFPQAKLAIGPAIENGFYYDFELPRPITPEDLPKLQAKMEAIIAQKITFVAGEITKPQAKKLFAKQPYKLELVEELAKRSETLHTYTSGSFVDLCKGPHLDNTSQIPKNCFQLSHAAGAYWRGDEHQAMLQRIYGFAFANQSELKAYLQAMEEAKKNDHRLLGPQLGIYMISPEVGAGLPLWLPKGETIKHLLQEYMRKKEEARGYKYVSTPVLALENLYQRSGHAQYYSEDMYSFVDGEGTKFYLKPMNCPHHHMIYEKLVTSYRDLPLKLAEAGGIYRNELSGTLTGLIRVRGAITQNDSHIYVTPKQLGAEFRAVLNLFKEVYEEMGIENYWFRLSLPDFEGKSVKYGGDQKRWDEAGETLRQALTDFGVPFTEVKGEASFYGPKVDVQIKNVTGKEDTIATSQVDILVPERMKLQYIDEQGNPQVPIIIHRAILGSYERFTAFLIEQTGGNFPFWLAPIQVKIISVSEQYDEAAKKVKDQFERVGLRVELDLSCESVGKKIRNASLEKIPAKIVIGMQEELEYNASGVWQVEVNWRQDLEKRYTRVEKRDLEAVIQDMLELDLRHTR